MKSEVLVYASQIPTFQRVTTGSPRFDLALGGGWPLNCWNEIVGQESNGKTVMALKTLAANMDDNPEYRALWVASEDFNTEWAETLGVDLSRTVLAQTNVMEEAYTIMIDALDSQSFDACRARLLPGADPHRRGREGDGRVGRRPRGTADQQADAEVATGPASQGR